MDLNKVELVSRDNRMQLYIDGVRVKGLDALVIEREASRSKTRITISFLCALNTKEHSNEECPKE